MEVTHIVRDKVKLSLLPQQEMVRVALGFPQLTYLHTPLLVNKEGKRLTGDKEFGEATYQNFLGRGITSQALVSYLLSTITGKSEDFYTSLDDFSIRANFSKTHRSDSVFSLDRLDQHNKKSLANLSECDYLKSFQDFLRFSQQGIELDCNSLDLIVKTRRRFSEAIKLVTTLRSPQWQAPDNKLSATTRLVLKFIVEHQNEHADLSYEDLLINQAESNMSKLGLTKREYYIAIRFILTGEDHGLDLRQIVQYLERTGTIKSTLQRLSALA